MTKRIHEKLNKDLLHTGMKMGAFMLLKSLQYHEQDQELSIDEVDLMRFNDSLQIDSLRQRITLLHSLINKQIQ